MYYASRVRMFRHLSGGRKAIARWTVPADECVAFRAHDAGIGSGSVDVNFYRLPATGPDAGIEVIFSDRGVLIDDGLFKLSFTGGRRVLAVDYQADPPPPAAPATPAARTPSPRPTAAVSRAGLAPLQAQTPAPPPRCRP